jgi:hypothetical protein
MEVPISKRSVSVAFALLRTCASTSRLPRNFHIGCPGKAFSETYHSNSDVFLQRDILHAPIVKLALTAIITIT